MRSENRSAATRLATSTAGDDIGLTHDRPRRLSGGVREAQLDADVLLALRDLINTHGISAVARMLDFPAGTVANAGAGAGLRRATRLLITDRIRAAARARAER